MLKIAIVGAGVMGSLHARTLSKTPDTKLVAICDTDKNQGESLSRQYGAKYYPDCQSLLENESLDGVVIAVPTSLHKEIALLGMSKKINLLIEKPLAKSKEDAQKIIETAKKEEVILTVGHIERFNPAVDMLKQLIKEGVLGEIFSIVVKRVGLYPPRVKDVNVVTDLAVHDLDIVCNLLGKVPKKIFATGGSGAEKDRIDYADIMLDFGMTNCYLQVNWLTPIKIRTISVTGKLGYAEIDYITQELNLYRSGAKNINLPKEFENFVKELGPEKTSIKISKDEPLRLEIADFLDSIRNKKSPKVTAEEGLLAVKLSETVLKSIEEEKLVNYEN